MNMDINRIGQHLANVRGTRGITLGIDGYIDEVWQIVKSRNGIHSYVTMDEMRSFGERIVACGQGGMANEIVSKRRAYGGFTGNTGKAVAGLGVRPVMLGMYGAERIDPLFGDLEGRAEMLSIGEPAICHILEFDDGKIMLPYMESILSLDWASLCAALPSEKLTDAFSGVDIVALGYWSNMPAFDELATRICEGYFRDGKEHRLFLDPADLNKRDEGSLVRTLDVLRALNSETPILLSLNEHEAGLLFSRFREEFSLNPECAQKATGRMRARLGLSEIIVHTPHFAVLASEVEGTAVVGQRFCEKPAKTAGAGDAFNGGYMVASLGELNPAERLAVANAVTGCYVRTGDIPDADALMAELAYSCPK